MRRLEELDGRLRIGMAALLSRLTALMNVIPQLQSLINDCQHKLLEIKELEHTLLDKRQLIKLIDDPTAWELDSGAQMDVDGIRARYDLKDRLEEVEMQAASLRNRSL